MIKNLPLLFLAFIINISVNGQYDRSTYYMGIRIFNYTDLSYRGDSTTRVNHITSRKKIETVQKKGKEKLLYTYISTYDTVGRSTGFKGLNGKNEIYFQNFIEYDAKGRIITNTSCQGKRYYRTEYIYGIYKEPTSIKSYYLYSRKPLFDENTDIQKLKPIVSKMHITSHVVNSFNADSNKISSISYNHSQNIIAVVIYEYDTLKKLGTAKLYGKKGKFQQAWNFDCSKNGEAAKNNKEQQICKTNVKLENGHTQEITINERKDYIERNIVEHDAQGGFVMSAKYVGKYGTLLSYKNECGKRGDSTYNIISYYFTKQRNNTIRFRSETVNYKKKTIASYYEGYYRKNKLDSRSTSTYEYNEAGVIVKELNYDEINKTTKTTNYTYGFFR